MEDQCTCDICLQIFETSQALFIHISQKHATEFNLNFDNAYDQVNFVINLQNF